MRVKLEDIPQATPGSVVRSRIRVAGRTHTIAFDQYDLPDVNEAIVAESLVYFKTQYAEEGYEAANVVPGGYFLANSRAYRLLPLLRAIRRAKRFRYDVYGRFGLRYGGAEIRRRAFEILSAREDFVYEGSLFRYPGGPEKVPYRDYLFEIPRAKVCVSMPGAGELTFRLVDYLAAGACVVSPPLSIRLPVDLVDGENIVYCAPDLSDLGDVCAQLVRDGAERERIAQNAQTYFDKNLRRERLGAYYLGQIESALEAELPSTLVQRRRMRRHGARALATAAVAALLLIDLLVILPEKLSDRPYNALGRNTHHQR